jgi:signal transduction histidine kinase
MLYLFDYQHFDIRLLCKRSKKSVSELSVRCIAINPFLSNSLINLLNNAFYAVQPNVGKVADVYRPKVILTTQCVNNRVAIRVADNGNGIPDAIKDKIFQPFFTTKPTGEGTGLGLSLSYGIVTKGHGGTLEMETKEGEGTTFIVQLPLV